MTATTEKPAKAPKTPKVKPVKVEKPKAESGPTARQRVFALISTTPSTGAQIKEKLGLAGIPSFLKDEGVCEKPRIRRKVVEGARGVVYELTALGKSDLAKDKVDDNAAPVSSGKEWPNGK